MEQAREASEMATLNGVMICGQKHADIKSLTMESFENDESELKNRGCDFRDVRTSHTRQNATAAGSSRAALLPEPLQVFRTTVS